MQGCEMTEAELQKRANSHAYVAFAIFWLLPLILLMVVPVSHMDGLSQVLGILTYVAAGAVTSVAYLAVFGWRYRR